jgi:D-sedoheptulose 7-phosphate isomerase
MDHVNEYFNETSYIVENIDRQKIEQLADSLSRVEGRVFVIGVGGSAGNASHMVNDLRKLCHIEAYAPTDNVSELTARTNDEGFDTVFVEYLKGSRFSYKDALFVLSVGGGNEQNNVSVNLVNAIKFAKSKIAHVFGIVGRRDGYAAKYGDVVVVVPEANPDRVTPHSEGFQAIVWHCLVSHPKLQKQKTKW